MKFSILTFFAAAGFVALVSAQTHAETETPAQAAKGVGRDVSKAAKRGAHSLQDKTCNWVHGKLECAAQKVERGAREAKTEAKEKADAASKETK